MKRSSILLTGALAACLGGGLGFLAYSQSPDPQDGYALLFSDNGGFPTGTALFSFRNPQGVLIWEAGVEAVRPIRSGRIFVEQQGDTRTAFALVNPWPEAVTATLTLRDSSGIEVGVEERRFEPRRHAALFVDELFDTLTSGFTGSLTFEADPPQYGLGAITLRESRNFRGESIFATLPVVDLDAPAQTGPGILPQVGGGPAISTQIVLINPHPERISGTYRFIGSSGRPDPEAAFEIEPDGVFCSEFSSVAETRVGYVTVEVEQGDLPASGAIFQLKQNGGLVSAAGVLATTATATARIFVDYQTGADNELSRTGVALAGPGNPGQTLTFRLLDLNGDPLGSANRTLPPEGHLAAFADELFADLPDGFRGLLEVSAPFPIAPVTLKLTINTRGDPILTTLPVSADPPQGPAPLAGRGRPDSEDFLIFPQIGIGGGLSTDLIFVNGESAADGSLQFFGSDGSDLAVTLNGLTGSHFDYEVAAGGGAQFEGGLDTSSNLLQADIPEFNLPIEPEINPATTVCQLDSPHLGGIDAGGSCGSCCPSGTSFVPLQDTGFAQASGGSGVYLHSGEFFVHQVDLEIPGRGFNWKFERKYRSGIASQGALGNNWSFNYERRLVVVDGQLDLSDGGRLPLAVEARPGDVFRLDGLGRVDRYRRNPDGSYLAPTGFYTRLARLADGSFQERDRSGSLVRYAAADGNGVARMMSLEDRHGNAMRFEYDQQGRLARVLDTYSRPISYRYNREGLLQEVEDFFGRKISFGYDTEGNLETVSSPSVRGTPNGNDFPEGKTCRYSYSGGHVDWRLNHNLLSITAPNQEAVQGPPRIRVRYDPQDRVISQTIGGANLSRVPAGGTINYQPLNRSGLPQGAATGVSVLDRNGNRTDYFFSPSGHIVRSEEFANRSVNRFNTREVYITQYEYNPDGQLTRTVLPEGNSVHNAFDDQNPDRFQQGNLLQTLRLPDAERGGDQAFIRSDWSFEPVYNQVRGMTDPRGNDPGFLPPNGGESSPERYTTVYTFDYQEGDNAAALADLLGISRSEMQARLDAAGISMNLGDINGDGIRDDIGGDVVRVERPTVRLLESSNMARLEGSIIQPIVELYTYNRFGQKTSQLDPEGNLTEYEHHPENDPDGDGKDPTPGVGSGPFGYLKQVNRDVRSHPDRNSKTNPEPVCIRSRFLYDAVGNLIEEADGRGIVTRYSVNQLNQAVQITRAAAHGYFAPDPPEPEELIDFAYLERIFYDFNDNPVLRQVEDRGDTSKVDGNPPAADLPFHVPAPDPSGGPAFVDTVHKYDILDNPLETVEEVENGLEYLHTRYRYDPNQNQVLAIQPAGNAASTLYEERDLPFRHTRGALSPPPLALLSPADPTDYNVRGGLPSASTSVYDRNRNLIETSDAEDTDGSAANNSKLGGLGDRTRYLYDGFDRQTSVVDAVGNQSVTQYDPSGNVVRVSRFGPVGGPSPVSDGPDDLPRPASTGGVIQSGKLVNANLLASTESLHDELNRVYQTDLVLFVNSTTTMRPPNVVDGAESIGKGNLTPGDNQDIPGIAGIDIIGRVSSRAEYDRDSRVVFTVEDDEDTYRTFYDGADRVIQTLDPEGNRVETAYDDNDNIIEIRETDVSQIAAIADEIFLTTHFYDSLDRHQCTVNNLGHTFDYRYDSRSNLVAMADAQGPVTGAAIVRRAFPDGTLTVNQINDFGNVTVYEYDGISRKTRQDVVLTASGSGDGLHIGADFFGFNTATPAPDGTQSADGLITIRSEWDQNSLQASLTDDNGNQTRYAYDNLNRRVTETKGIVVPPALADRDDPDTTITWNYDADDNVASQIDENGTIVDCRFDAIDRRIACDINRGPNVVGTTATLYEYDGLTRMTRATDNNEPEETEDDSLITYAYDSLSRLIEETQQIGSLPARAVSSAWAAENLRLKLAYPNGRSLEYRYDNLDRLDIVADEAAPQPIADYDYIGVWRVAERRYPINETRMTFFDNAGNTDVGYDGLRRTVQLRHLREGNSLIVGFAYTFDRMNNKLDEMKLHDPPNSEVYTYDSAYRLVDFARPNPGSMAPLHRDWQLDGVGNWREVITTEFGAIVPEVRQHSSFNELISRGDGTPIDLDYDDNGNLADDGILNFQWDYRNRLRIIIEDKSTPLDTMHHLLAEYSYDDADRRFRKVVKDSGVNSITNFYYDDWQVLEERDPNIIDPPDTLPVKQYVYGNYLDEPLVLDRNRDGDGETAGSGDQRLFYYQNTLHSVFALTDAANNILEGYKYEAYGHQTIYEPGSNGIVDFGFDDITTPAGWSALGNPYMFTGRRFDSEINIYYYRTRYLSPSDSRFSARDTAGPWVDESNLGNAYAYVLNNPTNNLDPYGWKSIEAPGDTLKLKECDSCCTTFGEKRHCKLDKILIISSLDEKWARKQAKLLGVIRGKGPKGPASGPPGAIGSIVEAWIQVLKANRPIKAYAVCEYEECEWCETVPGWIRRLFGEQSTFWLGWSKWKRAEATPLRLKLFRQFQEADGTIRVNPKGLRGSGKKAMFDDLLAAANKECADLCP